MNYFSSSLKTLKKLVEIPSVEGAPAGDMPFGEPVYRALTFMLDVAKDMGFAVKNYDNYVGEVIFGNPDAKKEDCLAILAHLDVVPEGDGWTFPAFSMTEKDGRLYGRGVVDDKGPAVLSLYAMKKLKDEDFRPKKTIKLILGCNEETGWGCIRHYKQVAEMPDEGFSPDADFPVIYAEKGICHVKLRFAADPAILSFSAGDRPNMVPGKATARLARPLSAETVKKFGLQVAGDTVTAIGVQAHGSTPDEGKNAAHILLSALKEEGFAVENVLRLFEDEAKLTEISDVTGKTTFSPDVFSLSDGMLDVVTDIRYAATHTEKEVLDRLRVYGVPMVVLSSQAPLYNDKDSFLIRTLLDVYNTFTQEKAEPIAIGGGTYARALKLGAGFGPEFGKEPSTVHQADENAKITDFELTFAMYYEAIKRLSSGKGRRE